MAPGDLIRHLFDGDIGIILRVTDDEFARYTVFVQFFGPDKERDWYDGDFLEVINESR